SASQIRAATMHQIAEDLRARGRKAMEIPLGASDALGSLGYIGAAEEIASRDLRFDAIFHSSSSGGTQAGLDVGLQIFGIPSQLIAVSPDGSSDEICGIVGEIRDSLAELLGVEPREFRRPMKVDDRFVGPGYGIPTPESND